MPNTRKKKPVEPPPADVVKKLQELAVLRKLVAADPTWTVHDFHLDSPGVKRRDVLRRLIAAGLVDDETGRAMTPRCYEDIAPERPDLGAIWRVRFRPDSQRSIRPVVILTGDHGLRLGVAQTKYLVEHHDEYRWYVSDAFDRDSPLVDDHALRAMTLREGRDCWANHRSLYRQFAVGTAELEEVAREAVAADRIRDAVPKYAKQGFVELGLIDGDEAGALRLRAHSPFPGLPDPLGPDPATWGEKLVAIHGDLLREAEKAGGWGEFARRYVEQLEMEVRQQLSRDNLFQ